ncbi:SppA protein [Candidatus Sumerlaeota bacterium]|nr:SppA protein [Candidatus Sumerlaeota bacterium]
MPNGTPKNSKLEAAKEKATAISTQQSVDVLQFAGSIYPGAHDQLLKVISSRSRRSEKVLLVLATLGGIPDEAYRIGMCLQHFYGKGNLQLFVWGLCKSAGTLLACGCDEIIMSNKAELGPLDIQIRSREEVGEYNSGLIPIQAMESLRSESFKAFSDFFLKLRDGFQFSTRLAAETASGLTVGLLSGVFGQFDPMRLGEMMRAMMIMGDYGKRLSHGNMHEEAIERLLSGYPSHGFVIDRTEAQTLFRVVRASTPAEEELARLIRDDSMKTLGSPTAPRIIQYLSPEPPEKATPSDPVKGQDSNGQGTPEKHPKNTKRARENS